MRNRNLTFNPIVPDDAPVIESFETKRHSEELLLHEGQTFLRTGSFVSEISLSEACEWWAGHQTARTEYGRNCDSDAEAEFFQIVAKKLKGLK